MGAFKILLDSCVWSEVLEELQAAGHDVLWAGDWPADPSDEEILARAHAEGRILVTVDKDLGGNAIVGAAVPSGIIRMVDVLPQQQAPICLQGLSRHLTDSQ